GVLVPPATYFRKVQAVLDKYDVLFIDDEVISGFGRLGAMFGAEVLGIRPDTISVAKQITSAYVPMGAVMIPESIHEAMLDQSRKIGVFAHGFTYSGHPVAAAVALKVLEIYEREDIIGQVRAKIPVFQERLRRLADHPLVGEARGLGLVGAVELVADKAARQSFDPKRMVPAQCVKFAQDEGLIVRNLPDTVAMCPPLIITIEEIHELFDRLERALDKTAAWVRSEGLLAA
ncbi:MAG: aminotransferase class III-fold pyridoxal phosphate-dependent enzyme, partial [Pseudomonadota bacterium]|nr:aminotransferase class III-fold pyridoxal phosphate-dependent enzyme [Pseudomonadota bacterium]